MNARTLKFILYNEDEEELYTNIPNEIPITPDVLLYNVNDSIEIEGY